MFLNLEVHCKFCSVVHLGGYMKISLGAPTAAVTDEHKLSDLQQHRFILLQFLEV